MFSYTIIFLLLALIAAFLGFGGGAAGAGALAKVVFAITPCQ